MTFSLLGTWVDCIESSTSLFGILSLCDRSPSLTVSIVCEGKSAIVRVAAPYKQSVRFFSKCVRRMCKEPNSVGFWLKEVPSRSVCNESTCLPEDRKLNNLNHVSAVGAWHCQAPTQKLQLIRFSFLSVWFCFQLPARFDDLTSTGNYQAIIRDIFSDR
jgi:hypothetical protein